MVEPVSKEDIDTHPWLASWNKIDNDARMDVIRSKLTELEDNLATASIIIITLVSILVIGVGYALVNGLSSGSVSISQVSGLVKQFTGK
jgi:hypothetical protein